MVSHADIDAFLHQFARARTTGDVDLIGSQYADSFMFADPNGPRVVEKAALLPLLAQGLPFLKTRGYTSTELRSFDYITLDDHYVMVRARLAWCFGGVTPHMEFDVDWAFIVYGGSDAVTIVFQHEPEDFRAILRSRGILPPEA
jgi:hypothetical protein